MCIRSTCACACVCVLERSFARVHAGSDPIRFLGPGRDEDGGTEHLTLQWTSDPMIIPKEILFIACILRTRKKSYDYVHEIIMFIFYVERCFFGGFWFLVFGMIAMILK